MKPGKWVEEIDTTCMLVLNCIESETGLDIQFLSDHGQCTHIP